MADILIRDMEMPERSDVIVQIFSDGKAVLYPFLDEPRAVEVVELPEHGDLIDRDVARDKIAEQETSYYMDMDGVDDGLLETPVIVPASKE